MAKEMQASKCSDVDLDSAITRLQTISRESQAAIASLISRLADAEGISLGVDFRPPLENVGHWLPKPANRFALVDRKGYTC